MPNDAAFLPAATPGPNPHRTLPRSWFAAALLPALLVLALVNPAQAATPCAGNLMRRVQDNYHALSSFRAGFTQTDEQTDGHVRKAEGQVAYLKPGRMRWEYAPPDEQLLVTDGKTVWLYDPLLENVTVQPLADLTQGTPLAFLLGAGNLEQDFTCRDYTRPPPDDGLVYLELVARQPIPALAYIQLGVTSGKARIASMRMVDTQGNLRWIRFRDLQIDVPLDPERFTFEITPGLEVIRKDGE